MDQGCIYPKVEEQDYDHMEMVRSSVFLSTQNFILDFVFHQVGHTLPIHGKLYLSVRIPIYPSIYLVHLTIP